MSREATDWAALQRPPMPADKLVLWALADSVNRTGHEAFPSVAGIAAFTMLERKRVMGSLARLEAGGWIEDTGKRVGHTRQVKVWRLRIDGQTVPPRDP